jgi:hypothetical protein
MRKYRFVKVTVRRQNSTGSVWDEQYEGFDLMPIVKRGCLRLRTSTADNPRIFTLAIFAPGTWTNYFENSCEEILAPVA